MRHIPYIKVAPRSGKRLQVYKNSLLPLTNMQKDIRVGTLLGDATIGHFKKRTLFLVKFEQRYDRISYVYHLYTHFIDYVGSPPLICRKKSKTVKKFDGAA